MRHTYACPVRWADLDPLNHINNVKYVDYLQEARAAFFAEAVADLAPRGPAEGLVVVGHEIEFAAPMGFRFTPVAVDTWVVDIKGASFTLAHEIYDVVDGVRVTYLRAWSRLAPIDLATSTPRRLSEEERAALSSYLAEDTPRREVPTAGSSRHVFDLAVRWSDLDPYGHVNNVKYVEYFQEARIGYIRAMHREGDVFGEIVVARTDLEYRAPMRYRREPYQVHTWISHLGTSSFVFAAEIRDPLAGDERGSVLARGQVVAVGFDSASQRSAPLTPDHRARIEQEFQAVSSLEC